MNATSAALGIFQIHWILFRITSFVSAVFKRQWNSFIWKRGQAARNSRGAIEAIRKHINRSFSGMATAIGTMQSSQTKLF
jgi:hypothetical protein